MANNYTIKDLIKESIRVYTGIIAVWPQQCEREEEINFNNVATFNGSYALNNGTLAFVIDNILYVTPSSRRAFEALKGFSQKYFYVPFSNGDYPKSEKERWEELKKNVKEEEFTQKCNEYSDKHGIRVLDEEVLSRCFVMPEAGVRVKNQHFEDTYYPILNRTCFDSYASERLGTFCRNNGRVVFVYRDGHTMVTKGYWIIDELRAAGYREIGIFVPFSNGEQILDPILKECWDLIKK